MYCVLRRTTRPTNTTLTKHSAAGLIAPETFAAYQDELLAFTPPKRGRRAKTMTLRTTETQIWRHAKSGEDFIVTLQGNDVIEAAGPITQDEVAEFFQVGAEAFFFNSDPDLADALEQDADSYRQVEWRHGYAASI